MRILKVSQTFALYDPAGTMAHVLAIGRRLMRAGHGVTVLTPAAGRRGAREGPRAGRPEVVYLPTLLRYRKVTVHPQLPRFCRQELRSFDLVHIYGTYDLLGPVVARYCRRVGVPFVLEPMGMHPPRVSGVFVKRAYYLLLGRRLFAEASRIITTSPRERQQLLCAGVDPERLVLRRNGVDPEDLPEVSEHDALRGRLGIPDTGPIVGFLGRIAPIKGLELLIEAFATLPSPPAWLVLAGPTDDMAYQLRLEGIAARRGIASRVLFPGAVHGARKTALLAQSDVIVLPSINENFGIAAAEALVCNTPVIVTENCGIAPYIGDAGLVVPREVAAMGTALRRLLSDPGLRGALRGNAAGVARRLSWDQPVTELQRLYAEVVDGRRSC